jgi:transposase
LQAEHGFTGGYTVVKDNVRAAKLRAKETFVPLAHPPRHAQVDFGEAMAVIAGVRQKIHVFFMDVPHSDASFMKAYPAETTEKPSSTAMSAPSPFSAACLCRFCTTTPSWLWRRSAAMASGSGRAPFTELISHYLFRDRFGRPGKGNDKGKVENLVKNGRRRFLTPVPVADSFDALNAE